MKHSKRSLVSMDLYEYHTKLSWYLADLLSLELQQSYVIKMGSFLDQKKDVVTFLDQYNSFYSSSFSCRFGTGYFCIDLAVCRQFCLDFLGGKSFDQTKDIPATLLEFAGYQIIQHVLEFKPSEGHHYFNVDQRVNLELNPSLSLFYNSYCLFQLKCSHNNLQLGYIYCLWPSDVNGDVVGVQGEVE
tara:strand:- start:188 stop:748 length:561 start_codon:yes stop_codon:yes gene_type:complete